jgi:potassium/hydrogen antiporter
VRRRRRGIRDFHEGLANASEIGLFLILGLLVFPSDLPDVWVPGVVTAVLLTLVARPIATVLCLLPARLPWRQQTVIGWAGLRGAVPIVLATFPITAGYPRGG